MGVLDFKQVVPSAILDNFNAAVTNVRERNTFTPAEEARADDALLLLFKLRDALVARDANSLACRIDEVLTDLEAVARKAVR